MLALKVVLVAGGSVPTLVFDEVDSGVGGATAAAVGERLARVAERVQVLVVTHSPQVAARGAAHLRVAKEAARRPRDDQRAAARPAGAARGDRPHAGRRDGDRGRPRRRRQPARHRGLSRPRHRGQRTLRRRALPRAARRRRRRSCPSCATRRAGRRPGCRATPRIADLEGDGLAAALDGRETVVSCAHARHIPAILAAAAAGRALRRPRQHPQVHPLAGRARQRRAGRRARACSAPGAPACCCTRR